MRASRAWLACLLLLPAMGCEAQDEAGPRQPEERSAPPAAADTDAVLQRELGVGAEELTDDALAWLYG